MHTPVVTTLPQLLRSRAETLGVQQAYGFLADGEREACALSYQELDAAARALAARLRARAPQGGCVLLAYPSGLEFIVAFFACLYAGLTAVPVCAPHPRKGNERLAAIAADCDACLLMTTPAGARALSAADEGARLRALQVLATALADDIERAAGAFDAVPADPARVALLQYTSGSTQRPRGVMVTHANLIANLAAIHAAEGNDATSRGLTWLPAYHDMGLIEGILQPLYGGYPTWIMPHAAFLQRPARWLGAITRLRATVSGGPNFAYELCLRRVSDDELAALDLRSWRVAYCGAEPVRADTLTAFAERFGPRGLRRSALRPVYGLAEATLLVSASERHAAEPRMTVAGKQALEHGRLEAAGEAQADRVVLVSCGMPAQGTRIAIVAATTGAVLPEGSVGEVWVSGPGVASGYRGRRDESGEVFVRREIADCAALWLRTGDLGCLRDGELYITGRVKDLIILRGRKLHPQDIEHTVERGAVEPCLGAAAAFALDAGGGEGLVICAELGRAALPRPRDSIGAHLSGMSEAIRERVYREHDIAVTTVAFVRPGGLARTSSGKLMRYRCRSDLVAGRMAIVARFDTGGQGRAVAMSG